MEFAGVKTVDELGHINLPNIVKQKKEWGHGANVIVYIEGDAIVIELSKSDQKDDLKVLTM